MDTQQIAALVTKAKDAFFNSGRPIMTDEAYDALEEELFARDPSNPVFAQTGAQERGQKIKLPFWMGSLDKIKASEADALERWKHKFTGAFFVVSDKLDGVSAMLVHGKQLFTRGDGEMGHDISHLLPYLDIPDEAVHAVVRGELVISKWDFESFLRKRGANARNLVSGAVNAKDPDPEVMKYVKFVPYAILKELPGPAKAQKRDLFSSLGFKELVYYQVFPSVDAGILTALLSQRRAESPYAVDGLVIEVDDGQSVPEPAGKNPTRAVAFKNAAETAQALVSVDHVSWNVSKDGLLKPTVEFAQIAYLSGVYIRRATGFNAAFIMENKIGKDAQVMLTRGGDVIPHIVSVVVPAAEADMPSVEYVWSDSKKDILVVDAADNADMKARCLEHFFDKLGVPGMGPGTIKKIARAGLDTVGKILEAELRNVEGLGTATADKLRKAIDERLRVPLECALLMEASNVFGRGYGEKKLAAIGHAFPQIARDPAFRPSLDQLVRVDGIQTKTAQGFLDGLPKFWEFVASNGLAAAQTPPMENEGGTTSRASETMSWHGRLKAGAGASRAP